jgi:hypothetical protein
MEMARHTLSKRRAVVHPRLPARESTEGKAPANHNQGTAVHQQL